MRAVALEVVFFEQADDGSGDFAASGVRRLDFIGVVGLLIADEAEVDERDAAGEGITADGVVEGRERGHDDLLHEGVGEVGVVDGADGGGFFEGQDAMEHVLILTLEGGGAVGEQTEGLGTGGEFLAEHVGIEDGVVAAGAEDEMGGLGGDAFQLGDDFGGGSAVNGAEGRGPTGRHQAMQMGRDVVAGVDVGLVVEDGVAKQSQMSHEQGGGGRVIAVYQGRGSARGAREAAIS